MYYSKESDIQNRILNFLNVYQQSQSIYFFRANSGSFNIVDKNGKNRYMKTGKKGCPDIILLFRGRFCGIEVKTKKGILSEYQEQACLDIEKAGGYYLIVRSVNELINDLKELTEIFDKLDYVDKIG